MLQLLKKIVWKIIPPSITVKFKWVDVVDAFIANLRYGFPGRKLKIIGITGTDGKTTTSHFLYSILSASGKKVGLISTIGVKLGNNEYPTGLHVTTPDPWELNRILADFVSQNVDYVVLEVTSHAIQQKRIWGIRFIVAGLTNITHEHLDMHHGDFEDYKQTKLSFLQSAHESFKNEDLSWNIIHDITLKLPGDYNKANASLAATLADYLGITHDKIKKGLESIDHIRGRMEVVHDGEFKVIVDFAHTPNGLKSALTAAKEQVREGRLIVVFGSAGERDSYKRPMMGEIAAQIADIVIITAEDPRSEKVEDITYQIMQGALKAGAKENQNLFTKSDRKEAIQFALTQLAKPGDLVIITGKGHEQSMNISGVEYPWSEFDVVKEILNSEKQTN